MKVKDSVLKTLVASGDEFISGTLLADKIGVSRNAVWKAVKLLENEGFIFDAISNKGYRISEMNNKLCGELIAEKLETNTLGRNLIVLDEVNSTNTYAKELASNGAIDGTTVIADVQTNGMGRRGRSFFSPSQSGVYVSFILRPAYDIETAQLITSCVACATATTIEQLCGSSVDIKWVNDLYMNRKKITGILTEASLSLETHSLDYAVVGIGVNLHNIEDVFDDDLRKVATSIESETGTKINRNTFCSALLNNLEKYLCNIEKRSFLDEYRQRDMLLDKMITVNVGAENLKGKAVGIDDNANLLVELSDGTTRTVSSGEASLCRLAND